MTDPLIQILQFGSDGKLIDITRSDRASYSRSINLRGLSSVVVIVASRSGAGDYTLNFDEVEGGADPMITRWNSAPLTEYEIDPRLTAGKLKTSPDLLVDEGVVPGVNNKLEVRIHNRGNMSADDVSVDLQYQAAALHLDLGGWTPVRDAANTPQTINGLRVAPNALKLSTVYWAPPASNSGWCVKATITARGDLNNDNNIAIGCFASSRVVTSNAPGH